jgi:hypothetical protein
MTSCDSTSNSTSCGQFWYTPFKNDKADACVLYNGYYAHTFQSNGQFCLHFVKSLHTDDYSVHKGKADFRNDTMFIDIVETDKFTLKTTLERKAFSPEYNIYFTSKKVPKKIFWYDKEIVDAPPVVIKLP